MKRIWATRCDANRHRNGGQAKDRPKKIGAIEECSHYVLGSILSFTQTAGHSVDGQSDIASPFFIS